MLLGIALGLCGCSPLLFEQPEPIEIALPDCDWPEGPDAATLAPFRSLVTRDGQPVKDTLVEWSSSHPEVWLLDQTRVEAIALPNVAPWNEIVVEEDIYAEFTGTVTLVEEILLDGFDLRTDHQGGLQAWLWVDVISLCDGVDPFPEAVQATVTLEDASTTLRVRYR